MRRGFGVARRTIARLSYREWTGDQRDGFGLDEAQSAARLWDGTIYGATPEQLAALTSALDGTDDRALARAVRDVFRFLPAAIWTMFGSRALVEAWPDEVVARVARRVWRPAVTP